MQPIWLGTGWNQFTLAILGHCELRYTTHMISADNIQFSMAIQEQQKQLFPQPKTGKSNLESNKFGSGRGINS
jgi:hypothetical protein